MKILDLQLPNLRNEEHFEFMSEADQLVEEYTPTAIDVTGEHAAFKTAFADEDASFKIIAKSVLTESAKQSDIVRDNTHKGLRTHVKAALTHFDQDVCEAAYRLKVLLDGYGNLATKSYDSETAAIFNLTQDLRSPKYAADVQKCNLGDWVDKLETDNNAFKAVMTERYTEQSEKDSLTRMYAARANTDKAYRALRDKVNCGIGFNGIDKYKAFTNDMNVRITRFRNIIAQRRGRSAGKSDVDGNKENDV